MSELNTGAAFNSSSDPPDSGKKLGQGNPRELEKRVQKVKNNVKDCFGEYRHYKMNILGILNLTMTTLFTLHNVLQGI